MAEYPSADALLADVRLRLDGLGRKSGALVVEGPNDKKLFYRRASAQAEIVPSGGKRLLRAGLEAMLSADKGRILFLTDCDYDVLNGTLHGGPDVVITNACDVEADLVALDLLERVVIEVVPGVVDIRDAASKAAANIRHHAELMARVLGRVRIAAQPLGVDLDFENFNLVKYWDKVNNRPLTEKIHMEMLGRLRRGGVIIEKEEWLRHLSETPNDASICNGKDLIAAARMILCLNYKMEHKITADTMTTMIRLALDESRFEEWTVVRRIRQWEKRNGRTILAAVA